MVQRQISRTQRQGGNKPTTRYLVCSYRTYPKLSTEVRIIRVSTLRVSEVVYNLVVYRAWDALLVADSSEDRDQTKWANQSSIASIGALPPPYHHIGERTLLHEKLIRRVKMAEHKIPPCPWKQARIQRHSLPLSVLLNQLSLSGGHGRRDYGTTRPRALNFSAK